VSVLPKQVATQTCKLASGNLRRIQLYPENGPLENKYGAVHEQNKPRQAETNRIANRVTL